MREPPVEKVVDGDELVHDDNQPEDQQEGDLGGFMPEAVLRDERPGPATDQFEEMQRRFSRAPATRAGFVFVPPIDEVGRYGEDDSDDDQR